MARSLASIKDKNTIDWKGGFSALKYLPRFFKEIYTSSKAAFLLNIISRMVNAMSPIVMLFIGKLLIDEIILQSNAQVADYNKVWWFVGLELGIAIVSDVINRVISLTDGLIGDQYSNYSSVLIIRKTKDLSISQLEDSELYDKLERARTQTSGRVSLMSNTLSQVQSLIVIISLIAGLVYFEPWLILILILSIIPAFMNELKFSSSKYSIARSWTSERRELDYLRYIGANDTTAKEMKLFGLVDFIADRFQRLSNQYYLINRKLAINRTILGSIFNLLGTISYYGAYVLIIVRAVSGVITIGDLTFLSGSFNRLRNSLQSNFSKFTRIAESALYLKDYFDFIDIEVEHFNQNDHQGQIIIDKEFEFKNVTFSYPGSDEKVLNGVSFTLHAGEKMAFVGQNGAGKTTLIKLLLRFYEPDSGQILLDGIDISTYDKVQYQQLFGVIFQDFIRYEFNVKENIGVGDISQIDNIEAIEEAARRSLADEVVAEMTRGYEQQLGRRFAKGKNLSGGQWQKIALARAYMKNAKVLVLDEPTSALDARAEYEAFQRFMGLTEGKTSIIISHRFSTVRMADRILVLKDGLVSEIGTHEQLMENNALYAELFTLQAQGYL
ncbi:MAG: ABC transporter ATP-binding protein [Saprospiraceae bacterium]|nr:ABC transporter ATP-binding protein [Saprospiraceae bacterium]